MSRELDEQISDITGIAKIPFSPSADAGDALAALEAFARAKNTFFGIDFDVDGYGCWIGDKVDTGFSSPSLCEVACQAIIAASEAAT